MLGPPSFTPSTVFPNCLKIDSCAHARAGPASTRMVSAEGLLEGPPLTLVEHWLSACLDHTNVPLSHHPNATHPLLLYPSPRCCQAILSSDGATCGSCSWRDWRSGSTRRPCGFSDSTCTCGARATMCAVSIWRRSSSKRNATRMPLRSNYKLYAPACTLLTRSWRHADTLCLTRRGSNLTPTLHPALTIYSQHSPLCSAQEPRRVYDVRAPAVDPCGVLAASGRSASKLCSPTSARLTCASISRRSARSICRACGRAGFDLYSLDRPLDLCIPSPLERRSPPRLCCVLTH